MSGLNQKTVKKNVTLSGVGLHSGKIADLIIKPAAPNTGIIFKRTDLTKENLIYPNFENVCNTSLNTTISSILFTISLTRILLSFVLVTGLSPRK